MKSQISRYMFQLGILLDILLGLKCWFTWNWGPSIQFVIFSIVSLLSFYYASKEKIVLYSTPIFFILIIILFLVDLNFSISWGGILTSVVKYYPLWVLISDKTNIDKHVSFIIYVSSFSSYSLNSLKYLSTLCF